MPWIQNELECFSSTDKSFWVLSVLFEFEFDASYLPRMEKIFHLAYVPTHKSHPFPNEHEIAKVRIPCLPRDRHSKLMKNERVQQQVE